MKKTEHTPTPWKIIEWNDCDLNIGIGHELPEDDAIEWITSSHYLPKNQTVADFRHIIRCVNIHDELVAALVAASQDIVARDIVDQIKYERENPHRPKLNESGSLTLIRSVLAKLKIKDK